MVDVLATMSSVADVRCPSCQSVDWFQDGCVIAAVDGAIASRCTRVQQPDPALRETTWSCNQCSHELATASTIARELDRIRAGTCDRPVQGSWGGLGVSNP
jgi:hypothetical protein